MPLSEEQQETLGGCCLLTMLAFGAALTVLVIVLAIRFL